MRTIALLALALLAVSGCASPASPAFANEADMPVAGRPGPTPVEELVAPADSRTWPDLAAATIRPGVAVQDQASFSASAPLGTHCTSNFVFVDQLGRLYLGTAAHCFDEGETVGSGGRCAARPMPIGTEVEIDGATSPGRLAYISTEAMARLGTKGEDACEANDFALIEIDAADTGLVHPAVLDLGGPKAIAAAVDDGLAVRTVGATPFRPGPARLDRAEGAVQQTRAGGWMHMVAFTPQRIVGDSGSPVIAADGSAVGIVGTLALSGNNGVVNLHLALDFARQATGLDLRLVTWDQMPA
jgi:hypothetical protein